MGIRRKRVAARTLDEPRQRTRIRVAIADAVHVETHELRNRDEELRVRLAVAIEEATRAETTARAAGHDEVHGRHLVGRGAHLSTPNDEGIVEHRAVALADGIELREQVRELSAVPGDRWPEARVRWSPSRWETV